MAYVDNVALFIGYAVLLYLVTSVAAALTIHVTLMRPVIKQRDNQIVNVWDSNLYFGFNLFWLFLVYSAYMTALNITKFFIEKLAQETSDNQEGPELLSIQEAWDDIRGQYWSIAYAND